MGLVNSMQRRVSLKLWEGREGGRKLHFVHYSFGEYQIDYKMCRLVGGAVVYINEKKS